MKVSEINEINGIKMLAPGNPEREIEKVFCCDLLSMAMSKAPAGACWVTVMNNINTLAVASLTDCACIVFAEGVHVGDDVITKANTEGIALFQTDIPVFYAGWMVECKLNK